MTSEEYLGSKQQVAEIKGKEMKAVALLNCDEIPDELNLSVVPEESDFPWHANIADWPEMKHEQKLIAQRLAAISSLE